MMKKHLFATLLAGVMLLSVGCSSSEVKSDNGSESQTEKHTIAVILKTLNSEYWNCVAAGIHQAEADFDCEVILQGPPSETSGTVK